MSENERLYRRIMRNVGKNVMNVLDEALSRKYDWGEPDFGDPPYDQKPFEKHSRYAFQVAEELDLNGDKIIPLNDIDAPKNREELKLVIDTFISIAGENCDLNWIDVSNVTDMSDLFFNSNFNGDISEWNVRNVENMDYMFTGSEFNGDISAWNVSNVRTAKSMFRDSKFSGDISMWDFTSLQEDINIFENCSIRRFNRPARALNESMHFRSRNDRRNNITLPRRNRNAGIMPYRKK